MPRPGVNFVVAAALGVGISVYTFLPLIRAGELERAKKAAESTGTSEPSATLPPAGYHPGATAKKIETEVGKK
ncbi:hypothetical protein B0H14DRAFT_2996105 [Mycena olivaceomarginata]|nr:hypothetical protein B0H14DRAFT_2996105 [Mycena olivaceomarginata]